MRPDIAPNPYHTATKHSFLSVQIDPNYVDSSTQPSPFKRYPKFFRRFPLEQSNPIHALIHATSAITYQKQYRDGAYALRVNPSAGALFPTELYVQLRGIQGLIDGIYHLELETNSLTLLYELIDDGIEGYFNDSKLIQGCLFIVSCVYFRSSWKYKNRSLRYCFLDAGHHLGAIAASATAYDRRSQILFDFDQLGLNDDLGFEHQEFATAIVISGEQKAKSVRQLRSPLPNVSGTDYFERNRFVEAGYKETLTPSALQPLPPPRVPLHRDRLLDAIQSRRSARRFQTIALSQPDFLTIQADLRQAIPTTSREDLEIYTVIHAVEGLTPGLYWRDRCLQPGDFREKSGYLCVNQAIARDAAVVFWIVSHCHNYRVALHLAGLCGQRIYLAATDLRLGCSGIGAFFDDETQTFLQTERCVLYAIAIGYDTAHPLTSTHAKSQPASG